MLHQVLMLVLLCVCVGSVQLQDVVSAVPGLQATLLVQALLHCS
jgi:hypothetical protein